MIDLRPNNAKVGSYYSCTHSKVYIYVIKINNSIATPYFTYSRRGWYEDAWGYPEVMDAKFGDVDEVRGENILGPRHPGDMMKTPGEAAICECGADKIRAPRHSTWCPKY